MKHVYWKYLWANVWQYPKKRQVWHREKQVTGHKVQVIKSMCLVGSHVLDLNLFCTHACSFSRFLRDRNAPMIWGYEFRVCTVKGETIYYCDLSSELWFDTTSIDKAEKIAEFVFSCMNR